ncbi:hypothetical protein [Helicobacter himalayensis]|uniref:hypothetical protein n=1 Tax=Helicobacter himalayensis TaxID=1591088 RepID=UPI00082E9B8E|nr:hypothetical protein [Helicobacter himalayensis]
MQEELLEERESEENPALQEETQELENSREIVSKLESELEQNMQSFEKDFAKFCAKEVENNPSLEELFFDDKEKFFEKILQMQNEQIKTQIQDKQEALGSAKTQLAQEEQLQGLLQAKKEFESKHPNVNVEELIAFYLEDLPKSMQDKLEELNPNELLETLLELKSGQSEESGESLPKQVSGYPTNTQQGGEAEALPTNRF